MQCLYCGKPLNLLRELADSEFCSGDHQQRYKRLTARAFTRLLETQPVSAPRQPPQHLSFRQLPPPKPSPNAARRRGAVGPFVASTADLALPAYALRMPCLAPVPAGTCPASAPEPARRAAVELAEARPLAFQGMIVSGLLRELQLQTVDEPPAALAGVLSHSPCLAPRAVEPAAREAEGAHTPVTVVLAQPSTPEICLPAPLAAADAGSQLGTAAYRTPAPAALPMTPKVAGAPIPLPPSTRLGMPGAAAVGVPSPDPAGLLPLGMPEAVLVGSMMAASEPLPCCHIPLVRRPKLNAAPDSLALRAKGAVAEEVFGADVVDRPAGLPVAPSPVSGSVLPALASLFRYGRLARPSSPLPHMTEGVNPRNRLSVPAAYMELAMPVQRPLVPRTSGLRIVETFEYVKPLEAPPFDLFQSLVQVWRRAPVYLRYAAVSACLILLLRAYLPGGGVAQLVASRWGRIEAGIAQRAAVELTDDFQGNMESWEGEGNWPRSWQISKAGYVRPGRLALYQPSMQMREYQVEFLMQVEKKAVSWAYRATDQENYYATKITIVKPGPLPVLSLVRYPVIGGREGPRVEIPIRVLMHNNTPYRVQLTVSSGGFSTAIEGQLVDFWRDDSLKVGGFGFFSDTGESARVYWMKLSHQNDFIGRVCAYFDPVAVQRRRSYRPQ